MKKKVLCIVLVLLMCLLATVPAYADNADNEVETPPDRANVTATFGLKNISGSTYKMWAKIYNALGISVYAKLTLYNVSYTEIASVSTTSTNTIINLSQNVNLSSGTYHLILIFTVGGSTYSREKTYTI